MADHLVETVDRAATVDLPAMLERVLDALSAELDEDDEMAIALAIGDAWLAGLHAGLVEGQARTVEAGASVDLGLARLRVLGIGARLAGGTDDDVGDHDPGGG